MKRPTITLASLAVLATGLAAPTAHAVDPGAADHQIRITAESSGFGSGISRDSCDVNGDGFDDTVVGDRGWLRGEHGQVGAAYVLFGSPRFAGGDLTDPTAAGAVRIDGPAVTVLAGAWAGWSVSCLGDVNGDGIDDIVVGTGSRNYHDVHVVFGAKDFGPLDLSDIGNRGYVITDPGAQDKTLFDKATDNFGYFVGSAGDVDGDGLADIAIADNLADYNGNSSGRVWVVKGKASSTKVDVQVDTDQVIQTIDGAGGQLNTVDAAGDVNGDGKDDLVVGSYVAKPWNDVSTANGAAYLVHGGTEASVIVGSSTAPGFTVMGPSRGQDRLGMAVSRLGDVNGDGLDDFVVGADGSDAAPAPGRWGGAAIVLGSASQNPVVVNPAGGELTVFECSDGARSNDCADATKIPRGYWINGPQAKSHAGFAVAGLPDMNGDEVPDVIIGAYAAGERGAAYVVHVEPGRTAALELSALTEAQGQVYAPTVGSGTYGRAVGSAGDLDGNGVPDFIFGGQSNNVAVVLRGALATEVALSTEAGVRAGDASRVTVDVSALVPTADTDVDGTVAVSVDGTTMAGLDAVVVEDGRAEVTLPGLAGGTHRLGVAFTPSNAARFAAAAAEIDVVTAKRVAKGRLALDSRTVAAGDDVLATVSSTQELTGEFAFLVDGKQAATATFVDGEATATLAGVAPGRHSVQARYLGDSIHAGFETASTTLRVDKIDAEMGRVVLSTDSQVYGSGPVTASVQVPGATSGQVTFYDNGVLIGKRSVGTEGTATITITAPDAGRHQITARFHGNDSLNATELGEETGFSIDRARLQAVQVKGAAFAKGKKPKVTVTLGKLTNGAYPVGTVKVSAGGKTYSAKVSAAAKGKVVFTLKKATKAVKVRATFTPTDAQNVARATSAKVTVGVRR